MNRQPSSELGGDSPCWAHLFEDEALEGGRAQDGGPLVVDLGAVASGSGGAIWSLPHGGDLDANLVCLDPSSEMGSHVNDDVDVLLIVQSGTAKLVVDEEVRRLAAGHLALIPKGSERSIAAGKTGFSYLSIHRQRSPLGITMRTTGAHS